MMKSLQSGKMLHSVVLQTQSIDRNSLNEKVNEWVDVPPAIRCAVEMTRNDERESGAGQTSESQIAIGMYYRADLDERLNPDVKQQRLKWGNLVLDIVSIDNVEFKNQTLILQCENSSRGGVQAK